MIKNIYLDVCALSRPFDNQEFIRIRLETVAVNLILSKIKESSFYLMVSPVHIKEIESISDPIERADLMALLDNYGKPIIGAKTEMRRRAEDLIRKGFGIADAAHLSFAEAGQAEFISCDDRLLNKCKTFPIKIWAGNPVIFCEKEGLR